jgi:hypothetical protein
MDKIILTIAILSLIGIIAGILYDIETATEIKPRVMLVTIAVLSWWNLCFPLAIILIVIGAILILASMADNY